MRMEEVGELGTGSLTVFFYFSIWKKDIFLFPISQAE
jgi:hypothetical protein